jgi:F-type H+-transporting ATPase subunit epsilon
MWMPRTVSKSLTEAREDLGQARNDEERHEAEARIEKFQALLS